MKWISRIVPSLVMAMVALSSARPAQARELCPEGPFAGLCNLRIEDDAGGIVATVMVVFFIIAIITCLIFILYGAFRYTTSAGDQGKAQQARQTIIAAVVGLVISLSTFFIVNVVSYIFTGQGLGGMNIPKLVN